MNNTVRTSERYGWLDGYRVLDGNGTYKDERNYSGPAARFIYPSRPDKEGKDCAALEANEAINKIIGNPCGL